MCLICFLIVVDVLEGGLIVWEYIFMINFFLCFWFNEVNRFILRD